MKKFTIYRIILPVFLLIVTSNIFGQSQWVSGTLYVTGDQVLYNGLTFEANSDLTASNSTQDPMNNQTIWEVQWVNGGVWVTGVWYKTNMIVMKDGISYIAIQDLVSGNPYDEPKNQNAYWELQWGDNDNWIANLPYLQGDIVTYNQVLFQATQNIVDKGNAPLSNCAEWTVVWTNGANWISGICYKTNMIVSYNNISYQAQQDITNTYVTPLDNTTEWCAEWNTGCGIAPSVTLIPAIPTLEPFEYTIGDAAVTTQSFSVSAENLTGELLITPPSGYEIATESTFATTYTESTPLSIAPSNGSINTTVIYVRLLTTNVVGVYVGAITINSANAESQTIPVIGTVVNISNISTCNPICPEFESAKGIDNTTLSNNILNTGLGSAVFNFNDKILTTSKTPVYHSSQARGWTNLQEKRTPDAQLVMYDNDIIFRAPDVNGVVDLSHGLGYYGSSYGDPNPDKKRNFADIHVDGPVLYGFNGGALGVRQFYNFKQNDANPDITTEKVVLQWTPNLVLIGQPDARVDLRVSGFITTQELWIKQPSEWYDNVFGPEYSLMSFRDLRTYVSTNKHLPDIPAEAEVMEKGVEMGEMNALLLKKVEELTLYILQLEERISELENQE